MNASTVQYYDSDFSYAEHAAEHADAFERFLASASVIRPSSTPPAAATFHSNVEPASEADLHPKAQSDRWDGFHSSHSAGNFFKSRRYITKCFPCILDHNLTGTRSTTRTTCNGTTSRSFPNQNSDPQQRTKVILEIGCGSGSTCVPILNELAALDSSRTTSILLGCDSSPVAVETTKHCVEKSAKTTDFSCFGAFVSDPSLTESETANRSLVESAAAAYRQILRGCDEENFSTFDPDGGIADIILCVFVLSAVWPARVSRFLEQVYHATRPGGKVCFRDYGMYDVPMMRFAATSYVKVDEGVDFDGSAPRLFVRGDGTISRFFHVETVRTMFEDAGFVTEELRYATVYNDNRKTKQRLKRVFVHGLFVRPEGNS